MDFYSLKFAAFFLAVFIACWSSPRSLRWAVLLAASYLFCFLAGGAAVLVLLGVSALGYAFGLWIGSPGARRKGLVLACAVVLEVSLLAFFKYPYLRGDQGAVLGLLLPLGISYYIFQAISYLADIWLEKIPAERHFGRFLLYLGMFPKLMQGPIERGERLLPQLGSPPSFDSGRAADGCKLVLAGLFKKAVVADRLAAAANAVFDRPSDHSGLAVLLGMYAFAFQLYFDFSGYTDIARGLAKLLGFELSENFRRPFLAANIQEFWRGWHMTFSSWIRDYVFMPLAALLRGWGDAGLILSALAAFIIVGLWHGATWGFLVFGALHGVYMAGSILTLKARDRWARAAGLDPRAVVLFRRAVTFHLVVFSFVFFRCDSLDSARTLLSRLAADGAGLGALSGVLSPLDLGVLAAALLGLSWHVFVRPLSARSPALFYAAVANAVLFFGVKGTSNAFLYFRF